MHNVISSGFFPSGELCWAEGGLVLGMFWAGKGVICRWQWGAGTERLVCFHVLFFLTSLLLFQFRTFLTLS